MLYMRRAQKCLERYCSLLTFAAYLRSTAFLERISSTPITSAALTYSNVPFTFSDWLNERMEIRTVLSQLDEDPTTALSIHRMDQEAHDSSAQVRNGEKGGYQFAWDEGGLPFTYTLLGYCEEVRQCSLKRHDIKSRPLPWLPTQRTEGV